MSDGPADRSPDLTRVTLLVVFIAAMIVTGFWIVRPFLLAALWAAMIVVTTWPLMVRVQAALWGKRSLAVALMTLLLLLVLIVPLALTLVTVLTNAEVITRWAQSSTAWTVPPPPAWVEGVPVVGAKLAARWARAAGGGVDELSARLAPYSRQIVGWLAGTLGSVAMMLVQFLLVVILAAAFYAYGEVLADGVCRFARRVGGGHGESSVRLAAQAVRGVALGVVVTALVQAVLAWIGLAVAGVPFATVLTAVVVVLCIAQIGPAPVLVPATIWMFWTGSTGWGSALVVWTLFVLTVDNVLRPLLIRRSADLPLPLVFVGVLGGVLAFGIIGLFVGPIIVVVGYSLLANWVAREPDDRALRPAPPLAGRR